MRVSSPTESCELQATIGVVIGESIVSLLGTTFFGLVAFLSFMFLSKRFGVISLLGGILLFVSFLVRTAQFIILDPNSVYVVLTLSLIEDPFNFCGFMLMAFSLFFGVMENKLLNIPLRPRHFFRHTPVNPILHRKISFCSYLLQMIALPLAIFVFILLLPFVQVVLDTLFMTLSSPNDTNWANWKVAEEYIRGLIRLLIFLFIIILLSVQVLHYLTKYEIDLIQQKAGQLDNSTVIVPWTPWESFVNSLTSVDENRPRSIVHTLRQSCCVGFVLVLMFAAGFLLHAAALFVHITGVHLSRDNMLGSCISRNYARVSLQSLGYVFTIVPSGVLAILCAREKYKRRDSWQTENAKDYLMRSFE